MEDKQKIFNAIGLIARSNNFVYGQRLIESIQKNKVSLVIVTDDMGQTAKKKVLDKAKFYNIEVIDNLLSGEELNRIISREKKMSAIGIIDNNMTKLIKSYIK